MAGPGQARFYSSTFVQTNISSGSISPGTLQFNVGTTAGAPGTPFVVSVDQNSASEELMLVTNISGLQYTVTRGIGGTSAVNHSNNAPVVHVMYAQDLTDASAHIGAYDDVHGLSVGSLVVGTTDTQTLSNKTLTAPTIIGPTISSPTITGATTAGEITSSAAVVASDFAANGLLGATTPSRYVGATAGGAPSSGTFTLGDFVIDTVNFTILICNASGTPGTWSTLVNRTNTETLSNKSLASPVITGAATGSGSLTLTNAIKGTSISASGLTGAINATRYVGATASGAPVGGAFLVGDFVIDQAGRIWVCVTAGSPGTWNPIGTQGLPAVPISSTLTGTPTSGTTDTIDVVLGNYQFTAAAGRRYRVVLNNLICNSGATVTSGDTYAIRVRDSGSASTPTTASTAVIDSVFEVSASGGSGRETVTLEDSFIASTSGTHTLAFFAQRVVGSNVFTPLSPANASGTGARKLWVEDLGTL